MTDLRCLSLDQPWASLVAVGVKSIETRSWPTKHRGRIGIASTKKAPRPWNLSIGSSRCGVFADRSPYATNPADGLPIKLPLGAIVATANLVDCVPVVDDGAARNCVDVRVARPQADAALRIDDEAGREQIRNIRDQLPYGDFTPGRWAWLLDDVKPTTERCPACWGNGWRVPSRDVDPSPIVNTTCPTCDGKGSRDALPVKGHQRLWWWNP